MHTWFSYFISSPIIRIVGLLGELVGKREGAQLRKHSKGSDWGLFIILPLEVRVGAIVLGEFALELQARVVIELKWGEPF